MKVKSKLWIIMYLLFVLIRANSQDNHVNNRIKILLEDMLSSHLGNREMDLKVGNLWNTSGSRQHNHSIVTGHKNAQVLKPLSKWFYQFTINWSEHTSRKGTTVSMPSDTNTPDTTMLKHRNNNISKDNCMSNSDCFWLKRGICLSGKCVCKKDYYRNGYECIKIDSSLCQSDLECSWLKNSVCLGRKCVCEKEYLQYEYECIKISKYIGDFCTKSVQCRIVNSECEQSGAFSGSCQCKNGYEQISNTNCSKMSFQYQKWNVIFIILIVVVAIISTVLLFVCFAWFKKAIFGLMNMRNDPASITPSLNRSPSQEIESNRSSIREEMDKPPPYEEAIISSRSLYNPSLEDIEVPPSYNSVQTQSTSHHSSVPNQ